VKPRIPLAYAGLLIIALAAVAGFAAFSPGTSSSVEDTATTVAPASVPEVSARVASAVLALRVTESESRIASTVTTPAPSQEAPDTGLTPTQNQTQPDDETTTTTQAATTTTETTAADEAAEDEPVADDAEILAVTTAPPTTSAPTTTKPRDTTPPSIKVTSHKDGATVTSRVVTFSGTSEAGAKVVSGPYAATMSSDGHWTIKLAVVDGANGAKFTATDKAGNSASTRIVVNYDAPSSSPTTTKASPTTTRATTTTTKPAATTTTKATTSSKWSPNWPADAGGIRNVEAWRSTVAKYWPSNRVDCVLGIIYRESKGDPRAYNSSSRAEGLMQHLSKYWVSRAKGAGFVDGNGLVATPFNGAANIAAGAYLGNYYDRAIGQWWNPWKSGSGGFTANYGSCTSSNPG
jgi:hypothetical protein